MRRRSPVTPWSHARAQWSHHLIHRVLAIVLLDLLLDNHSALERRSVVVGEGHSGNITVIGGSRTQLTAYGLHSMAPVMVVHVCVVQRTQLRAGATAVGGVGCGARNGAGLMLLQLALHGIVIVVGMTQVLAVLVAAPSG